MQIQKNYNLAKLNTFGISSYAAFFAEVESVLDLLELFSSEEFKKNKKMFLGGGSNILFTKDFDGIIILNKLKGIKVLEEDEEHVLIHSMGGERWNNLVSFSVLEGYWGIENLALIPGTVGAAPIQNIGAYGVEIKDTLHHVEAVDILSLEKKVFTAEECELGYRESVFKNKLKDKYFITAVVLKLSKKEKKNLEYKALKEYLEKNKIEVKNSKDVSDVVGKIRGSKLPDPKVLGNAGSFFKNIFVEKDKLRELQILYPEIPYFEEGEDIKIPAGWLIEQCGWRGVKIGNVGVHEKQALILVNHGGATGEEIKELAEKIIASVLNKFDLKLFTEVNMI